MQLFLGLSMVSCWLCLVTAYPTVRECADIATDMLDRLQNLTVVEDVHDKLSYSYRDVWAPKPIVDADQWGTCIQYTYTKLDENRLRMVLRGRGAWFQGTGIGRYTAEKVENGVYLMKNSRGKAMFKQYELYNTQFVRAFFSCALESDKTSPFPHFTTISVRSPNYQHPLEEAVQWEVDEILKVMRDNNDIFAEMAALPHVATC